MKIEMYNGYPIDIAKGDSGKWYYFCPWLMFYKGGFNTKRLARKELKQRIDTLTR
jgi:hypothetical protein